MPDNGSGTYDLAEPGPINGATGDATPITANFEDIRDALTARLLANGTKTPTANQPMGGFKHTNVNAATARTEYARASQVADSTLTYGGVAGGTADALTITPSPAIAAYAIGQKFQFKVGAGANTTAATLNVNGVGVGAVTWPDGTALAAGDLPANGMVEVEVQALTPIFHLQTQTRAPGVISGSMTVGGSLVVANTAAIGGTLSISSTDPAFRIFESDAASNEKYSQRVTTAGKLIEQFANDALNATENWLEVDRTGINVDTIILKTDGGTARITVDTGVVIGAAAGGDKGANTLNAEALYFAGNLIPHKVATLTASASATLVFTNFVAGSDYEFRFTNILPATDNVSLRIRYSTDGGSSYNATAANYKWGGREELENATGASTGSGGVATSINIFSTNTMGNVSGEGCSGTFTMHAPDGAVSCKFRWDMAYMIPSAAAGNAKGAGNLVSGAAINGIEFAMSSGNIASGTIEVWRIPRS